MSSVTKRYRHEVVVDDLSFTVQPGRVTGFLGPNGAGKSTTMKILLDLATADHGHATIGGTRYRDMPDPARTVGVVLEPNAFHPGRSGRNHLRILADGAGIAPPRIDELLEMVGLAHAADRHVGAYSLGMRQRLGLAAALLGDPPVLVLDEPGNGLDPQGIRWLRDLLRARAAAGGTVFVSSHLLAEVEHLADEVVVISHGRLVATGRPADAAEGRHLGAHTRTGAVDAQPARCRRFRARRQPRASWSSAASRSPRSATAPAPPGSPLHELTPQAGSLEELFLDWTSTTSHATRPQARRMRRGTERQAVPL